MSEREREESTVADVAAAWVARLRASDVTNDDRAAFAAWLARDVRHRREFDATLDLWQRVGGPARAAALPVHATTRRSLPVPLAVAAAVLLGALLVFTEPWEQTFRTAHGDLAMHVLDDGSRLHLNTATSVKVDLGAATRRVTLDYGELFVEVAPDARRPFTVATRRGDALAVGTAFAVRDTSDRVFVTVAEGRVRVSAPDGAATMLNPGDQAALGTDGVQTQHVDATATARWREGALVYDGVRLADLVDDLNRYLPRRITIEDPALGEQRVSAVLQLGDQEEMLEALSRALALEWTVVSDVLIILHAA